MFKIQTDSNAQDFLNNAGYFLYKNEALNSSLIGVCGNIISNFENHQSSPVFLRVIKNQEVVTAAILVHSKNLLITSATEEQLKVIADYLNGENLKLPGIWGPLKEAEAFSAIWEKQTGKKSKLGMNQKIFKIEKVSMPNNVPGILRNANSDELGLISNWFNEFSHEAMLSYERKPLAKIRAHAETLIKNRLYFVWENDGAPVAMAYTGRPTLNGLGISAVYSPVEQRKKGYASALVSSLSQKIIDSGKKFCVLFSNAENLTSNRIYQRMGYEEVSLVKHFIFD
jgi:uncharacterized protein